MNEKLTYELAVARVEEIIRRLDSGDAGLRETLEEAGVEVLPGRFFDVRDPSGNRVQIVQYDEIQFTKTDRILSGMGLELGKSEQALAELRDQGLAD